MKRGSLLIINLVVLAVGLLFIAGCRRANFIESIIFFSGILFIVPSVINMILIVRESGKNRESGQKSSIWKVGLSWACCIGATILGAVMCFRPLLFLPVYVYIFSISLFLAGCYHLYMIVKGLKPVTFAIWVYALPVVLIAGSVVMFLGGTFRQQENQGTVLLMAGIGLIIFAVTSFIEIVTVGLYNRRMKKAAHEGSRIESDRQIEDVKAKEQ